MNRFLVNIPITCFFLCCVIFIHPQNVYIHVVAKWGILPSISCPQHNCSNYTLSKKKYIPAFSINVQLDLNLAIWMNMWWFGCWPSMVVLITYPRTILGEHDSVRSHQCSCVVMLPWPCTRSVLSVRGRSENHNAVTTKSLLMSIGSSISLLQKHKFIIECNCSPSL